MNAKMMMMSTEQKATLPTYLTAYALILLRSGCAEPLGGWSCELRYSTILVETGRMASAKPIRRLL